MRSFLFENIWLLSRKDRRGRCLKFHRHKNLIQGRNHTGKSSLIKMLFLTLGARPKGDLTKWDEDTISLVDFRVDGQKYRALHQRGTRALFDEGGSLILTTGDHGEWSRRFADVTGLTLFFQTNKVKVLSLIRSASFSPSTSIRMEAGLQSGARSPGFSNFRVPLGQSLTISPVSGLQNTTKPRQNVITRSGFWMS